MSRVPSDSSGGQFLASPSSSSLDPAVEEGVEEAVEELGTPTLLAIRTDGAVLLSVEEFSDRDFTGRTLWKAVVLTASESAYVHQRGLNAAYEVAAKLSAKFPRRKQGAEAPAAGQADGQGEVPAASQADAEGPTGSEPEEDPKERGGT